MELQQTQANESQVTEEVNYWLKVKRDSRVEGLKCLEDAAKQIVVVTSFLQGMYFAAVSFSDIKKVGNVADFWFVIFVTLSFISVTLWVVSLYFATHVFVPETYHIGSTPSDMENQSAAIRNAYDVMLSHKQHSLRRATTLLWLSFLPLAANIFVYLIFLPAPPP